ncbi:MAG: hypothetical protein KAT34_10985 [Candidatus Aminicenantes bacterium]|nr:hypothetical protein [Candidatus Aminicenantes bacterium]
MSNNEVKKTIEEYLSSEDGIKRIDSRIHQFISIYKKIGIAFLVGLGLFIILAITSGLTSKQNIIVWLHDKIFGIEELIIEKISEATTKEPAISYHRSFILDDPNQRIEKMLFLARPGQKIEIYLEVSHYGTSLEKHRINVWLDERILYENKVDIKGGFKEISDFVFSPKNTPPLREESIHSIEFNLVDNQSPSLDDKIFIDCVVVVYGKRFDENK